MHWKDNLWLAFDTEATGVDPASARVFEVGFAVGGTKGLNEQMGFMIDPGEPIPPEVERLTGVHTEEVLGKVPHFCAHGPLLLKLLRDPCPVLVGYNAYHYDIPLLRAEFQRCDLAMDPLPPVIDPLMLVRGLFRYQSPYKLEAVATLFGVRLDGAHRAQDDAAATLGVLAAMADRLPDDLDQLLQLQSRFADMVEAEKAQFGYWLRQVDEVLIIGCGKHAGTPLGEMEEGYLRWVLRLPDLAEGARQAIQAEITSRNPQLSL